MTWKKVILWVLAVLAVLPACLAIVALLLVQSPSARRALLVRVERYASESTGTRIEIRDFGLGLFPLHVRLDGIVAAGRSPSVPPLLQVERVSADIKLGALLKRQWHLPNLVVHRPVVRVLAGRAGQNNLPHPNTSSGAGFATIFNFAIDKCMIDGGEIYFNDAKSQLEAEMYDLRLRARFDHAANIYQGALKYDRGKVTYGRYAPVVHNLEADFAVTPTYLQVDRLAVVAGQSRVRAYGQVENFRSPIVQATYDAQLSVGDIASVLNNISLPEGAIHFTGSLRYQPRSNAPFLRSAAISGNLSSPLLRLKRQAGLVAVRDLSATYRLTDGNVELQGIRARALGGNLDASLTIRDFTGVSEAKLLAHLRDVSLEEIENVTQQHPLAEAHLSGTISANAEATWARALADLETKCDATLEGTLGGNPSAPLKGVLHADYTAASHEIELRQSYLRTPSTELTLDGKVSRYSQLQVAAHSDDLHELELLAANLRNAFSPEPPKLDLYGSASFNGSVTGLVSEPQIAGRLEAHDLRVKGSSWKLLRANLEAGPAAVSLSHGSLEAASHGNINFNVRAGLDEWSYRPDSPVDLEIAASKIPVSDLERLTNQAYPVSGMLSGNIHAHGSQLNPVGHGDISLTNGKILSEPLQSVSLNFEGQGRSLHANLRVRLPAGVAQAQMEFDPTTRKYQAHIQADNIRLEYLQSLKQKHMKIVGEISLDAAGGGTVSSPELTGTAHLSQLRLQEYTIPGLTLTMQTRERMVQVEVHSDSPQTPLQGSGTVEITPPFNADLNLDTARLSLQPLLALYAPALAGEVSAQTELHASVRGPLQDPSRFEAHLEIPTLTASYHQLQLGAVEPVRIEWRNNVLALQPVTLHGTGTDLRLQATVPLNKANAATYQVEGTVDLSLVRMLQPGLSGGGQIHVDLDSHKQAAGSEEMGELRLVNASLHSADLPLGLDSGNGVVTVSRTRLDVKTLQAQVGGGQVTARGGIRFRPALEFDLGLSGNDIRLRYPDGVRGVLNTNLTFAGSGQETTLGGTVNVQRLSLTRDFDLQRFINQLSEQQYSAPSIGFDQRVRLNLELQSGTQVDVASTKVSVRGDANLRVLGTAAEPIIVGRAHMNGGDLFLGGNRYVLQSGAVDFVNPVRTEPIVNAQVKTKIDQYEISLNIQGPMQSLNTTFTSEPPLPPADIINLLAFGQTTKGTGGNLVTPGNLGAQSVLAQGLGTAVSGLVERFAGLSYFSIDPALGGSNQNPGARVVIQQRVTSNLVVTYSTDVTSTGRQAVQLEYRLNPKWSVSGVRDQNGGFGAAANYHTSF